MASGTFKKALREIIGDRIFFHNPVVAGAVGICPIIATGITLRAGILLSLAMMIVMIPTCIVSNLFFKRIKPWLRMALLALTASVFYIVAVLLLTEAYPDFPSKIGLYAPILVVSSVMFNSANDYAVTHSFPYALAEAISSALGFALIMCLVSGFREALTYGTLGGKIVFHNYQKIAATAMPFFGMIVIGYFGAIFQKVNVNHRKRLEKHLRRKNPTATLPPEPDPLESLLKLEDDSEM